MKKVVFLYTGSSYGGGLSTYLTGLFKNFDSKNVSLTLVSIVEWETTQKVKELGGKTQVLGSFWELTRYLRAEGVNTLITAGVKSNLYGRLASFIAPVKIITTVHSDITHDYQGLKGVIFGLIERVLRFRTVNFITVSEFLKRKLIGSGIPESKITVIYNGVEFPEIQKSQNERIIIGSIGRLHKTKGFDILIKAAMRLPEDLIVKIWGEGDCSAELTNEIIKNKLEQRVHLEGYKPAGEALAEVDIYVQPSRMEGFGLALVEAMGAGIPVIATRVGAIPEIINDGQTGILVDPENPEELAGAIMRLVQDESLRGKMGVAAQKEALSRFGVSRWVGDLVNFLESA